MFEHTSQLRATLDRLVNTALVSHEVASRVAIDVAAWEVPGEPVPFHEATAQTFQAVTLPLQWSHPWGTTWFRLEGQVPDNWPVSERLRPELSIDLGFTRRIAGFQAEGLIYDDAGNALKGIEPRNNYLPLAARPGERFSFWLEAAANPFIAADWVTPTDLGSRDSVSQSAPYVFRSADVILRDAQLSELLVDIETVRSAMEYLPEDSPRRHQLRAALERLVSSVDLNDPAASVTQCRAVLAGVLHQPAPASAHVIHAVGHAHIDTAWLWPLRETRRKAARTYSNVLRLMDEYPDWTFAASSAQQYAWVKEDHPDLFQRIAERVREGRWIPVGGQWIEPDPTMIGGEAFLRQFVAGQAFFEENFGTRSECMWLPDSFGYSAQLPAMARHAGMRWFLTQKMSWNDSNTFPHHTFTWEGLDGSEVLTHFPPVNTYNSVLNVRETHRASSLFKDHGDTSESLAPFGYGDGGGGPTRLHLGRADRMRDLDGTSHIEYSTPERFFQGLENAEGARPRWVGELYLEYHRGVFTSQSEIKRGNRESEHWLHTAELWATTAAVTKGTSYPYEALEEAWRRVLVNQFHDILPGSSINWVNQEAVETYAELGKELSTLTSSAISALTQPGTIRMVANSSPLPVAGVPAGAIAPAPETTDRVAVAPDETGTQITNQFLQVHVRADGSIDSLVHRATGREIVPPGETFGSLVAFNDLPGDYDAWNLDRSYRGTGVCAARDGSCEISRSDDGTVSIISRLVLNNSSAVQRVIISPGEAGVGIEIEVDWHDRHRLLKLLLPVAVHATEEESDIQFGHVRRPIHTNTSWDEARFETVGHRWVRVSEPSFGVAVANAQTYGHSFDRTVFQGVSSVVIGESLLRGTVAPDPAADEGRHRFRFEVVPGADLRTAIERGYALNCPQVPVLSAAPVAPLVSVTEGSAVMETLKLAEDRSGDAIVRLYESMGDRTECHLTLSTPARKAWMVNALEDSLDADAAQEVAPSTDGLSIVLPLGPYQIRSLRLSF